MDKFKEFGAALDEEFDKTQNQIAEVVNMVHELHNISLCRISYLEERLERQKQHNKSISNILHELADRLGEEI